MKNFVQPGTTLTLPAPYDVASGAGFLVGSLFAIAFGDAAAGAQVEGVTAGVFALPKTSAQAWAVGARIYWDDVNKRCDGDSAKGRLIGVATVAAANPSTVADVRLNGSAVGGGNGVAATVPGQPAKPVLTALAGAVSLAWTTGAAGSTATTGNSWTDINGNVTQLTTNPQVISGLPAGTPYTGTVTTRNAQGPGPASAQADAVTPTAAPSAVPFDSTVAFSSGQKVLYAGGLYTFTAAHPAGNWTGNDVTYDGQNGDWPLNTVGYSKPLGMVNSWTRGVLAAGTTTAPTQSRGFKLDMEAPFTALRVELFQLEPSPMRGFAISLASTETDSLATLSLAIDPIVNGVAHSVIRGADPYGLARVSFDSALRSPVQAPGGTTPSGRGYFTNPSSVLSEWLYVSSVPVVSGKRPMVVGRLSRTVNAGDANSNVNPSSLSGSYNRYVANDPSGRLMYHPLVGTNGDHVADPTLSKTTGSLYDATTGGVWQNMAIIAQHSVPTRVSVFAGDSIFEGYFPLGIVAARLSTLKAPIYAVNLGCSTNTSSQYLALLESYLRGENYATDVTISAFSANEPQLMTIAFRDALIARLQYFITMCAAMKKRLYICTSYVLYITRYSVSASDVAIIQYINDWVRTEAAKPGATFDLVEVANGWDNATMTLGGQDNIHPTAAGNAHFDSRYTPVFQKGR